jgi:CubicO group peptidase (beta-lactamase class C family)
MRRSHLILATLSLLCHWVTAGVSAAADDAEARNIRPFLRTTFAGRNSCIVIGQVDAGGSRIFAAGKLDNGTTAEPDGDTVFLLGSVTKTFTALLLQEMADRGEVQLDDPVAKYLPTDVKLPTHNDKPITLLDLATHTSALPFNPGNMAGDDVKTQYESYTVQRMDDFLAKFQLPRDPGTEFAYSNVGFALLGHALSLKAGKDFETLVLERICQPLAMHDTRVTPTPEMDARLAMGHDEKRPSERVRPWRFQAYIPAGGIHSTASDLLKYTAAEAGLSPSPLAVTIEKTQVIRHIDTHGEPDIDGFGTFGQTAMDWVDRGVLQPSGSQLLGHAGGAGSYHAFVGFDTKQHHGVVVLSTDNEISVEAIGFTLLLGKPLRPENAHQFEHQLVGIGVALQADPQKRGLRIFRIIPKSPAADAGLLVGDVIHKTDDQSLEGKSIADSVKLLRGDIGTTVMLEVIGADGQTRTIEVTRRPFAVGQ